MFLVALENCPYKVTYITDKKKWIKLLNNIFYVQLVAYRLGTGKVPGSNPGKGKNFSVKICSWIVRI